MKKSLRPLLKDPNSIILGNWNDGDNYLGIEKLGLSGLDYVFLDAEHGFHTGYAPLIPIIVSENAGLCPIIRVPGYNYEDHIKKALDAGASGILVPNVKTREDMETAASWALYAPEGNRGACPYLRSNEYATKYSITDYYAKSNEEVSVIMLLETREAVENFEEIVTVPGLHAVLIGRADLSVSLGIPGQYGHPKLLNAIQHVRKIAQEHGMPLGMAAFTVEEGNRFIDEGYRFMTLSNIGDDILKARAMIKDIRSRLK